MIWRVFLVKTQVCESNGVAGHLLENPVNSSMKCIEATLLEITLLWNPQYCKGEKKNIVPLAEEREKNKPTPSGSLSSCLSSSAGILNTFLWDLLRIWKDWSYTWLDRHCATLLNLMRRAQHSIKIEREAVRTRFLRIDGEKSLVKAPQICVSSHPAFLSSTERPYWYLDDALVGRTGIFSFKDIDFKLHIRPIPRRSLYLKDGPLPPVPRRCLTWGNLYGFFGACLQWWGSECNKCSITYTICECSEN